MDNKKTASLESNIIDEEDDILAKEREELAGYIRKRRRLVLAMVATIFTVTALILVMSVIHVEMNKAPGGVFMEQVCSKNDEECIRLQCPEHMVLNQVTDRCEGSKQVISAGIVMSGYKETCHANYIWVDWRQKCLRRN